LIAAIVIVGLVIGLATAVNSVKVGNSNEAFYDLADEIGFETKKVLDYGVFNEGEDTPTLTREFLEKYTNYIAQEQALFIYGDVSGLQALFFEEITKGNIGIDTGTDILGTITITDYSGQQSEVSEIDIVPEDGIIDFVNVEINGITYQFDLRQGQNFFFVIIKEQDGEKFVATG